MLPISRWDFERNYHDRSGNSIINSVRAIWRMSRGMKEGPVFDSRSNQRLFSVESICFLPQSKTRTFRSIEDSILPLGVSVRINDVSCDRLETSPGCIHTINAWMGFKQTPVMLLRYKGDEWMYKFKLAA